MGELSNIQKIIQILNFNEAKTWVHNNDADIGLAGYKFSISIRYGRGNLYVDQG